MARRAREAASAALWLFVSGATSAGMIPMTQAIPDFHFNGNAVDYDLSLTRSRLTLGPDNVVQFTVEDAPGDRSSDDGPPLRLRADRRGGELLAGQFNVFGSLTPATEETVTNLVNASVGAMQGRDQADVLGFMLDGKRATGSLARQFRNIGIYTSVAGVADEDYWATDDGGGSLMSLRPAGDVIEMPVTSDTPVPATPLLLMAGLALLVRLRRRQSGDCPAHNGNP